jgi:hypothetical protein
VDQAATEATATFELEVGRVYTLKLEYYENGGNAICQLTWQPPGHPAQNARSVWAPPGLWHDAWTGVTTAGPQRVEVASSLRHMPIFVRDGGIVATIPQVERTETAVWPKVIVDVFVPAEPSASRTERFIYEDDGVSPDYRLGKHAHTPVVMERNECGVRIALGPTAGSFPGLPSTRSWVVRLHLWPGANPENVAIGGAEGFVTVPVAAGAEGPSEPRAGQSGTARLLAPEAEERMPFAGEGMHPGPGGGPVLEILVPERAVGETIEIRWDAQAASDLPRSDVLAGPDVLGTSDQRSDPDVSEPAVEGPFIEGCTGFPCANFSVAGEVSPAGELFKRIMYNPPVLGAWLQEWGRGHLALEVDGKRWTAADCQDVDVVRSWPTAGVQWGDPALSVKLKVDAWAPVVAGDAAATALPVLAARLAVDGPAGKAVALEFELTREIDVEGPVGSVAEATGRLDYLPDFGLGWAGLEEGEAATFQFVDSRTVRGRAELTLPAHGTRKLDLLLLFWHPDGWAAGDYKSMPALYAGVRKRLAELETATAAFPSLLPASGEPKIDEYLRWYMTAGVMLTRLLKDGTTLTMGYAELNQRDSFWTSFMHLHYWPEAERRMLEESALAVGDDGKVPTCILPLIEREDDIDINEYFILRAARYYREYGDMEFLEELYPATKLAMEYLIGRCAEGSALPEQQSIWADWKDVGGVEGRRYGPHFVLLYLAALKEMAFLAGELGETGQAEEWDAAYVAAEEQANLSVAEGGLWNGSYYVNVWRDGRKDEALLEDQMVAGAWGVIPPERFASIRTALNAKNEQPWGVRETFPYYPADEFGLEGGDYHNGGIWPWLNFADAIARCRYGYPEDALRIMKEVGQWDLEAAGDHLPHENLHGETGQGIRRYIQGWNSAYLGAILWGLQGKWPEE